MSKIIKISKLSKKNIGTCISIIGGGPAAVSLVAQLVEQLKFNSLKKPLEILVFEKNKKIGPGLPYSQKEPSYILNLPRENMNPVFGKSGEFSNWLKTQYPNLKTSFPPRYMFGEYLEQLGNKLQIDASNYGIKINYFTNTTILNISKMNGKFVIQSRNRKWETDYTVLATGCMPSEAYSEYIGNPDYWHNPWDDKFFSNLRGNEAIGIIGTRLSAVDIAVRLLDKGHQGQIIMGSRTGLLPTVLANELPSAYPLKYLKLDAFPKEQPIKLETLMKLFFKEISFAEGKYYKFNSIIKSYKDITPLAWLNKEISRTEKGPKPWQQVIFESYPHVPFLWSRLSLPDQKKFMAQYYSSYMTYLAAFPLINAYKIRGLLQSGQLKVLGALNLNYRNKGYIFQNESDCVRTQYLLNATGPGYKVANQPLYKELLKEDIMQHPLGGLRVNKENLEVLNHQEKSIKGLFAVGELTKGSFLATTDMARVAQQSNQVATSINQKILVTKVKNTKILPFFPICVPKRCFSSMITLNFIYGN